MNERFENTRLRSMLREAHTGEDPPPFDGVWAAAGKHAARGISGVPPGRRERPFARPLLPRLALAAGLAASLLTVTLLVRMAPGTGRATGETGLDWTWSDWTGPTDFLLETPGSELLGSTSLLDDQVTDLYETTTTQERTES